MALTWGRLIGRREASGDTRFRQAAALPLLAQADGTLDVALVTSRETGRWVLPKGWIEAGLTAAELATKEAVQEAGLQGRVTPDPIGSYCYRKRLHVFASVDCRVDVFPLIVTHQQRRWKEAEQRSVRWMRPHAAAVLVDETDLAAILMRFETDGDLVARVARL